MRWQVHDEWKGHANESRVRKLLRSLSPDSLSTLLLNEDPEEGERSVLLEAECKAAGIDIETVKYYWYKSERFSINANNPQPTRQQILDEFLEIVSNQAPKRFSAPRSVKSGHRSGGNPSTDPHLLLLGLTDLHVDKFPLVDMYQRIHDALVGILQYTAGFNIEKAVIIIGSDALNSEGATKKTLKGTPADNAIPWHEAFPLAIKMYQHVIDTLLSRVPVDGICLIGNHDTSSSLYLGHCIDAHYKRTSHVTIDTEYKYRKAFRYGCNLIGLAHGHGPRKQKFTQLLAAEYPRLWGETTHRYMNIGHFHADYSEKLVGCNLRVMPSPSTMDDWSNLMGYTSEMTCMQALLYNKNRGGEVVIPYSF